MRATRATLRAFASSVWARANNTLIATEMGGPKRPASQIKSDLGRAPPAKHDAKHDGRTASTWDEGPPLAWDTLVLGHRRAWDSLLGTNGRLNQLNTSKLKKKKSKDNLLEATPPARTRDGLAVGRGGG